MWKKSSSISTKDTVVNLYTRNSHFCMAVLKLRRKMYFAFWYFDALVCFIMFCFLYGHQFYFRQKIDHVQTRDNQGIAPAHTYSPFLYHSVFRFLFNFRSLRRVSPCVISCVSTFEGRCRLAEKLGMLSKYWRRKRKKSCPISKIENERELKIEKTKSGSCTDLAWPSSPSSQKNHQGGTQGTYGKRCDKC